VLLDGTVAALADAGTPVESVNTDASVTLRLVDGTPTITTIELATVGRVPGSDEAAFKARRPAQRRAASSAARSPASARSRSPPRSPSSA